MSEKHNRTPIIRAADYLPVPEDPSEPESFQLSQSDAVLLGLFGDAPDYSDPKFEELWQEVLDAEKKNIIAYCLEKGVDLLEKEGEPVPGWRDIAVMLKAIDSGLLELDISEKADSER